MLKIRVHCWPTRYQSALLAETSDGRVLRAVENPSSVRCTDILRFVREGASVDCVQDASFSRVSSFRNQCHSRPCLVDCRGCERIATISISSGAVLWVRQSRFEFSSCVNSVVVESWAAIVKRISRGGQRRGLFLAAELLAWFHWRRSGIDSIIRER